MLVFLDVADRDRLRGDVSAALAGYQRAERWLEAVRPGLWVRRELERARTGAARCAAEGSLPLDRDLFELVPRDRANSALAATRAAEVRSGSRATPAPPR